MNRSPKPVRNPDADPAAKRGGMRTPGWRPGAAVLALGAAAAVLISGCASDDGEPRAKTSATPPASASAGAVPGPETPSGPAAPSAPAAPPGAGTPGAPGVPPAPGGNVTTAPPRGTAADDKALLDAARRGDADAVRAALARGANIEARDGDRRTPLLLAAIDDRVDAARVLVEAGADPDAKDDRNDTAWLVTGVTGSVEMARALLPANPDFTALNRYGGTSLIPAGEHGHVDYVRFVTTNTGVDVDHVNNLGWTALLEAVVLGDGGADHQEVVRLLLAAGADPGIADKDGVTALRHAERSGYRVIADTLRAAS